MKLLMTAAAFCAQLLAIANGCKTAYMLGPWGWPANDKMITRATTQGSNAQTNRQWLPKANAIKGNGFLFDCVGLIKGILWGWCGDLSRTYGGAGYACNGVPDYDAKKMIDCCRDVSTDFSAIVLGEAVWMDGHIGVYVGAGVVVESTPKWQGGVQCSTLSNLAGSQKLSGTVGCRRWTKHGKLPWIDYAAADKPADTNTKEDGNMTKELEEQVRRIVREEIAKMEAERAALPAAAWAEEELAAAVAAGITDGKRPQSYATRQEMAIMVGRGAQRAE